VKEKKAVFSPQKASTSTLNGKKTPDRFINDNMKITFWGAAKQVTGSMFLVELADGYQILIDCGLDMENRTETDPVYPGACFPFEPSMLNLVVLTHAHLDHTGKVPNLYREGYEGQVICSSPTFALTELLLYDSAGLNRKKLNMLHKKRSKQPGFRSDFPLHDLYFEKDVEAALDRFIPIKTESPFKIKKGVYVTLIPSGHLLGACSVLLEVEEDGEKKRVLFSGDLGRKNYPLLKDPGSPPAADYVICEATYGNRLHQSKEETEEILREVILDTCVKKPGRLIIPAFSIGRTQAILFTLNKLFVQGVLPPVKIYADSPLAQKSNIVYERYAALLNDEALQFKALHKELFQFDHLEYIYSEKDSKRIASHQHPAIIISSSGMLEGGRILHHIRSNLGNPYCTILMVGFSAEGTFGNKLLRKSQKVKMGKHHLEVKANIVYTDAFSGHGDQSDLLDFLQKQRTQQLKRVFLVHGEPESLENLKNTLTTKEFSSVEIPEKGISYHL
jgi:metallo-beta-lactamase family protein